VLAFKLIIFLQRDCNSQPFLQINIRAKIVILLPLNQKTMKMKALLYFFTGTFIVLLFSCSNEPAKVPEKVSTAFDEMFPGSANIEWEMDDEGIWEVEYNFRGTELESSFNENGEWLETERELEIENIPEKILKTLSLNYKEWKIEEAEFVKRPDFSGYEINLEKGNYKTEVLVSADGEIVETVTEIEKEKD